MLYVDQQGTLQWATNPAKVVAQQIDTQQKKWCRGPHAQIPPLIVAGLVWKRTKAASLWAGGDGNVVDLEGGQEAEAKNR